MKILFLGYEDSPLISWLIDNGEEVFATADRVSLEFIREGRYEFLISYGYRHIIPKEIIDVFEGRCINLHISYLPWNRGADPNLWSFIDDTKKGVTIHILDEGLDTGDILVQSEIDFDRDISLKESYVMLHTEIQKLFKANWEEIKNGKINRTKQPEGGSYHRAKDKDIYAEILSGGYEIKVSELLNRINGGQYE